MDNLKKALIEWDGIHKEALEEIYETYAAETDFFPQIVDWTLTDPSLQIAATWLVKHHYDNKASLEESLEEQLIVTCNELKDWQSQLHLLQLLASFSLKKEYLPYLEAFVRKNLESERPFLRAWAMQGLFEIYQLNPALKPELEQRCQEALKMEKASVKARVRKIIKLL